LISGSPIVHTLLSARLRYWRIDGHMPAFEEDRKQQSAMQSTLSIDKIAIRFARDS
jgi:hypothetical protein